MTATDQLQRQLDGVNREITEIENLLESLYGKKQELECKLKETERNHATSLFLQTINTLSEDNTARVRLYSDTRTTPIMDSFYKSDKKFLVFEHVFTISSERRHISLVVVKSQKGVNYKYTGMTMTDLKKSVGVVVTESSLSYRSKRSRLYALYEELVEVGKKHLSPKQMIPFAIPCLLGGQTFSNQTGFGWEYRGEDLVYQGKEYGETTKFFIIGVIVEE